MPAYYGFVDDAIEYAYDDALSQLLNTRYRPLGNTPLSDAGITSILIREDCDNDTFEIVNQTLISNTNHRVLQIEELIEIIGIENSNALINGLIVEDDIKTITHVSNFRPVKNINTLIKVFSKISKKFNCKFNLIGEGPDLKVAKSLSKKLKINNIHFLGNTNEVEKVLCHSDIFILPSKAESFGLAALEAMASKNAIVSSNSGGLPELNLSLIHISEPTRQEARSVCGVWV